jgi:ParB family chromosome partitioning protein
MKKLSLLNQIEEKTGTTDFKLNIKNIPLGEIQLKQNVRDNNDIEIDDLKTSIKQVGLLQPITVYKANDNYICLMGHRRLTAYKELYKENRDLFHSIKCIITGNENITAKQLIENIQRKNLKDIELYNALKALKNEGLTTIEISKIIGKKEQYIKDKMSIVNHISENIELEKILSSAGATMEHIKETKHIKNSNKRLKTLEKLKNGEIKREEIRKKKAKKTIKNKPKIDGLLKIDESELSYKIIIKNDKAFKRFNRELSKIFKKLNIELKDKE